MRLWIGGALLLACGSLFAATLPDPGKPGGAQAGQQYPAPVPPNMRRFLAKPPAEPVQTKPQDQTRIQVTKILLDGVVERPDQGVSLTDLQALVEKLRQKMLAAQPPEPAAPISAEERAKLLKEITDTAKDDDSEATLESIEEAIQQYRKKATPADALSLRQLQEIAAQVAQYYRERGFILVRVVIPPQTIKDGLVHMRVLEGLLGNITIEKNQTYNREQMLRPFEDLLGQPVVKAQIEEAMLILNDYPGLSTFAVFRPGLHPGETDLLLSVIDEQDTSTQVHADNYGSEFTGEYRARVDVHWNNPFSAIDRLSASLSKTYNPHNGTYGALYYERHAFGPKNIFGIGASKNDYSLGAALKPFGIKGSTTIAEAYWRRAFQRSRLFNSYALLQLSRKSAKLNIDLTQGEDRADELTVASIEAGFDWASRSRRNIARARARYSQGFDGLLGAMESTSDPALTDASRQGGSGIFAGGKFAKTNIDYDHWYHVLPNHTLHVSLRGQYSQDLLTSLEQMPIGGPNSVRAYATSEFLRDKAVYGGLEWLMRAPGFSQWKAFGNKRWGELLQFSLFVDYAKGWLNDPLGSDREVVSLSGMGAGVHFQYEKFSARFEFASPLGDEPVGNDRDPQYFFEMNYGF